MRQNEFLHGIDCSDEKGQIVGQSKVAAAKAFSQVNKVLTQKKTALNQSSIAGDNVQNHDVCSWYAHPASYNGTGWAVGFHEENHVPARPHSSDGRWMLVSRQMDLSMVFPCIVDHFSACPSWFPRLAACFPKDGTLSASCQTEWLSLSGCVSVRWKRPLWRGSNRKPMRKLRKHAERRCPNGSTSIRDCKVPDNNRSLVIIRKQVGTAFFGKYT